MIGFIVEWHHWIIEEFIVFALPMVKVSRDFVKVVVFGRIDKCAKAVG
jgi:hypothetical protein